MSLLEEFNTRLKEAMKSRNAQELGVLRMVKTRFQQKKTEKGFSGEVTDDVAREVVAQYVKQMKRALEDFERAGDQGAEKAAQARFEIDYLKDFLPQLLSEEETRKLVETIVAEQGLDQPSHAGRVVGAVMKTHKGKVDPALVKKLATEILAG